MRGERRKKLQIEENAYEGEKLQFKVEMDFNYLSCFHSRVDDCVHAVLEEIFTAISDLFI